MTEEKKGIFISRRGLLQNVVCAAGAAAMVGTTFTAAHAAKLPPTAVGYRGSPHGSQSCKNCRLFVAPSSCKSVAGSISPNGWCHIYNKA
jgi:hypothetical protein